MADNTSTILVESEIPAANMTESLMASQTFTEALARIATIIWENRYLFLLESRIIFTALACIYIGSMAALSRPPSANPPKSQNGNSQSKKDQNEDEDEDIKQGLLPSDAILLPILAGTVLTGLYYLIKWLEDPDILNKILRVYFSIMSLTFMGMLFAHTLHFLTGFIFPTVWRGRDGRLYHIDSSKRGQWYTNGTSTEKVWDDTKKTPLPGWGSGLSLSDTTNRLLWEIRHLLTEKWTVRFSIHGVAKETFKVRFNSILGVVLAIAANIIYYTAKSTFLSNVMGYAVSYVGIGLISPTTFATGTIVLFGLFFYDIYMVFYTPYMVTVATKLDVPIKLVFEGPTKSSMLGLGDIVLPGLFIALCLRFDLYMYYHRQRKLVPVELKTEDATSGKLVVNTETQRMVVKPDYINPQGQWGDWFWSTKLGRIFSPDATPALKVSAFPKPYFYTALFGYLLAMVATLVMLLVYRHAQPALLYLVPGVVTAVWTAALVRGELREMWRYTEDGSLDTKDTIVEVDGNGNVIDVVSDENTKKGDKNDDKEKEGEKEKEKEVKDKTSDTKTTKSKPKTKNKGYPVFLFSIEAPAPWSAEESPTDAVLTDA